MKKLSFILCLLAGCATTDPLPLDAYWCYYDYGRMRCVWIQLVEGPPKYTVFYMQCENCGDVITVTNAAPSSIEFAL